jgi:hypothetical protein
MRLAAAAAPDRLHQLPIGGQRHRSCDISDEAELRVAAIIPPFRPAHKYASTQRLCRARTRTMALSWYFLSSSGRSPILVDQAADDLPARDLAGHVDRLAGFM